MKFLNSAKSILSKHETTEKIDYYIYFNESNKILRIVCEKNEEEIPSPCINCKEQAAIESFVKDLQSLLENYNEHENKNRYDVELDAIVISSHEINSRPDDEFLHFRENSHVRIDLYGVYDPDDCEALDREICNFMESRSIVANVKGGHIKIAIDEKLA